MGIYVGGVEYDKIYAGGVELTAFAGGARRSPAADQPLFYSGRAIQVGSSNFQSVEPLPSCLAWDGTTLFMSGQWTSKLYDLDPTTGVPTALGRATAFDVSEVPLAFEWDGTDLLMLGADRDLLYTVDRTTGIATPITNVAGFGVGELLPAGLAWDGTTLFMAGQTKNVLYTLDRTTGRATQVGSTPAGFGVGENGVGAIAWDGTNLIMVGTGTSALYYLDRTTGMATRIGSQNRFGVGEQFPYGLAWDGTQMFMTGSGTDALFTLERTPDQPGSLNPGVTRRGTRQVLFASVLTDLDGIARVTSATLTARDGQTADITSAWARRDANTLTHTDSRNNARWRSGTMAVTYVDGAGNTTTANATWAI